MNTHHFQFVEELWQEVLPLMESQMSKQTIGKVIMVQRALFWLLIGQVQVQSHNGNKRRCLVSSLKMVGICYLGLMRRKQFNWMGMVVAMSMNGNSTKTL